MLKNKVMNDGAVPLVAYRYRTKGQQWLWLETRFELLNNGFNCKNYAIQAHHKVITLNEMLDSNVIIDSIVSSTSAFEQATPISLIVKPASHSSPAATSPVTPDVAPTTSASSSDPTTSAKWQQPNSLLYDGS